MPAEVVDLEERRFVAALRAGDPSAYEELHARYGERLVALAMSHGCSRAVAQEVVQDTWAAVVRSIDGFQGRSSLKDVDLPDPRQRGERAGQARAPGRPAARGRTADHRCDPARAGALE